MAENMKPRERRRIEINGMKFRADRLVPNYRGEYDDICGNCIFNAQWVDFGEGDEPCRRVECMQSDRHNGNRNVWVADGDMTELKRKPVTWWVEYRWMYRCLPDGENRWEIENDNDAQRIVCTEEQIDGKVRELVKEAIENDFETYDILEVEVTDYYITSDYEV